MNLNRKGYMLVEIILASVIAFGVAYFLINLTYKFKDTSELIYNSIDFETYKSLITKNIMNDLERGVASNVSYDEANRTVTFQLIMGEVQFRRLVITDDTITYGRVGYDGDTDIQISDVSYYSKKLPKSLKISKVEFVNVEDVDGVEGELKDFKAIKIFIESLYENKNYDIKLLFRNSANIDLKKGSCFLINLDKNYSGDDRGNTGTAKLYFSYEDKNFYSNPSCDSAVMSKITIPTKKYNSSYKVHYVYTDYLGNDYRINEDSYLNSTFDGYYLDGEQWIDRSGNILKDKNSIVTGAKLTAKWSNTNNITLPSPESNKVCLGWYKDINFVNPVDNSVPNCNRTIDVRNVAPTGEATVFLKTEPANFSVVNLGRSFAKFSDALNSISTSGTIRVEQNTNLDKGITIPDAKNVTLNLNNKRLDFDNYNITNNGSFILNGSGTINRSGSSAIFVNNSGKRLEVRSGKITINGNGNFINNRSSSILNMSGSSLINNGTSGTFINNAGNANITGGSFSGASLSINNTGNATISSGSFGGGTRSITNSGSLSMSGTNNFAGVSGNIIQNSATITVSGGSFNKKSTGNLIRSTGGLVTVNGGSFTNSSATGDFLNISGGSLKINGGSFVNNGSTILNVSGGNVNISGSPKLKNNKGFVLYKTAGTITISGGTYVGCDKNILYNSSGSLSFSKGVVKVSGTACVAGSLLYNKGTATLSGGTIWNGSANGHAIHNAGGTLTTSGTTLKAYAKTKVVAYASVGTMKLNGGTFYSPSALYYKKVNTATVTTGANYKTSKTTLAQPAG